MAGAGGNTKPTGKRGAREQATIRREKAIELRCRGKSYAEIADELGINKTSAYRLVQSSLKDARKRTAESAEDHVAIELARLDAIVAAHLPAACGTPPCDRSAAVCIRAGARRARLLGLDAPTQHRHAGPEGGPIPFADADEAKRNFNHKLERLADWFAGEAARLEQRDGAPDGATNAVGDKPTTWPGDTAKG